MCVLLYACESNCRLPYHTTVLERASHLCHTPYTLLLLPTTTNTRMQTPSPLYIHTGDMGVLSTPLPPLEEPAQQPAPPPLPPQQQQQQAMDVAEDGDDLEQAAAAAAAVDGREGRQQGAAAGDAQQGGEGRTQQQGEDVAMSTGSGEVPMESASTPPQSSGVGGRG